MSLIRHTYEFGSFSLDVDRRLMLKGDQAVPLTSKAFDTLLALVENHSRVVEKDELLKRIWPDTVVEERNLAVNISILRRALGESPESHEYIVTIPGRGYRFVAPLRELGGKPSSESEKVAEQSARASPDGTGSSRVESTPVFRSHLGWRQAILGSGLIAALISAFAVGRFSNTGTRPPAMRLSAITNFSGVEGQPAFSPDGRSMAFVSNRGGQSDIWVGLLSGGNLVRVTNDPNVNSRPRWSPDSSKLLYARLNESGRWDSWVVSALGGVSRRLISDAVDPTWSPDSRSIAYANLNTGGIWICDAAGRDAHPLTAPELPLPVQHRQPAFSRDGGRVAFVRRGIAGPYGELAIAELATGRTRVLTDDVAFAGSPVWAPDGKSIYFASGRGGAINVWKIEVEGGRLEQITVGRGDDADLDVSADGKRILFSSYRVNINLEEMDLDDSSAPAKRPASRKRVSSDSARAQNSPAYSHDGKYIAYFTNRRGTERESVWAISSEGGNPMPLVQDERVNLHPRWSRDGQWVIYGSRTAGAGAGRFWGEIELRRVLLSGGVPQTVRFRVRDQFGDVGPQDRLLYRSVDGPVQIFDLKTNQVQALKDVEGTFLRWSPGGNHFAALINAREPNDAAGVWVYSVDGRRQQVFRGWAAFYGWAGANELLILEGKPDLDGTLWRVRLGGKAPVKVGAIRLMYGYWHTTPGVQFDVHPDGRRIVTEALELQQADISLIDNIR